MMICQLHEMVKHGAASSIMRTGRVYAIKRTKEALRQKQKQRSGSVTSGNSMRYGRNYYDYQEGTLVFMAPGQVVEVEVKDKPQVPPKGRALLFHPDLIRGTSLGRNMKNYTF